MATKKTMTLNNDGMATLAKEAVSAGREWSVAMREAAFSPMLKMFAWNQPVSNLIEPWVEMTRQAHDRWLECWESQNHEIIDQTTRLMGVSTERIMGQIKSTDRGDGVRATTAS